MDKVRHHLFHYFGNRIKEVHPDNKDEYKEFTHTMECRIFLQPLEKQHNLEIDITSSYILRWQQWGIWSPSMIWQKTH